MLRIAICDDQIQQISEVRKLAEDYIQRHQETAVFTEYTNAFTFLEELDKQNYDLVLLDVCMPGMLGTEVANEMREKKYHAEIIFLTTSDEFAVEAFALKAIHYLVKPVRQELFDGAMDRALEKIRQSHSGKIIFRLVGCGIQIEEVDHIAYVESDGHVQRVYLTDGTSLDSRQSLTSLLNTLECITPGQFVSPGKGFIVNQKAIHVIKSNYIEIQGKEIPIAKRKYRQFQEDYFRYIFSK